jgi:thiamine monophosphate kinase
MVSLISTECCNLESSQVAKNKAGGMLKVAQELSTLYDEYSSYMASHRAGVFRPSGRLVRVVDDRVVIDAVAFGDDYELLFSTDAPPERVTALAAEYGTSVARIGTFTSGNAVVLMGRAWPPARFAHFGSGE